jgi:hypothetical protein
MISRKQPRGGKRTGAGRPALPPGKVREKRIALRLTDDEYRKLEAAAGEQPVSEWLRHVGLMAAERG